MLFTDLIVEAAGAGVVLVDTALGVRPVPALGIGDTQVLVVNHHHNINLVSKNKYRQRLIVNSTNAIFSI